MPAPLWSAAEFAARLRPASGAPPDRTALGRAVTLAESTRPADRELAAAIVTALGPPPHLAARVGLTGVPGVGKSTLIEAVGRHLVEQGRRVAVLAVDPSSQRTGGSILGDKTRMPFLATHPGAFVRPSPAGAALGGVAPRTGAVAHLLEAVGFDVLLIETVGVGQSETAVRGLTDCFVLLLLAGAGDELQGIKKGIIEMADVLAVTKADGANAPRAAAHAREMAGALHLLRAPEGGWLPPVLTCSAAAGTGIAELWTTIEGFLDQQRASGRLQQQRQQQRRAELREVVRRELEARFFARPEVGAALARLEAAVGRGELPVTAAVGQLLALAS